jgi:hypothetical protein
MMIPAEMSSIQLNPKRYEPIMDWNKHQCKCRIHAAGKTTDTLTSRAGLSLFVRYLEKILLYPHLERLLGEMRKSMKGQPVPEIFQHIFCFMLDGTSRHLVRFDALKEVPWGVGWKAI